MRLDTKEGAFRVKDGKTVIVPGKSAESELFSRIITRDPDDLMPPPESNHKLTVKQIELVRRWIDGGAKWGRHWAFNPITPPAPPRVKNKHWPVNEIDRFVLARLDVEKLAPSPEADRERLIRRVTFDLTGLPPAPAEIDAFLADKSSDAYEKVVDRLLNSPRYGERMAASWLDVARYADTYGYQMDAPRPVWPYRDWVIKSFNENLPFDRFVTWQVAGDLLPDATKEQRLATAFWAGYAVFFAQYAKKLGSLIEAVNLLGSLFYGSLLGVFVLAFWFRRVNGTGAFIGMLAGEAAIFWAFWFTGISFLWYNVIGCVVVIATGLFVSWFRPSPRKPAPV